MVTQIPIPPEARARSTLGRIDYADAFVVDVPDDKTAEEWARKTLEEAPAATRASLQSGWSSLGLRLDLTSSHPSILGWRIRENTRDHVLLGADGRLGLSGELLFERRVNQLRFSTFVKLSHVGARAVWAAIEPAHVRIVRGVLEGAVAGSPCRTMMRRTMRPRTRTELAVLGLLAWSGESSGYELHKRAGNSVGFIWAPARSQLYAVLKRLEGDRLVSGRRVAQADRPDKRLFRLTDAGTDALEHWLGRVEPIEPEDRDGMLLKLFFGAYGDPEAGRRQLLDYLERVEDRLATYRRIERTFDDEDPSDPSVIQRLQSLRLGIALMEASRAWAQETIGALAAQGQRA
jgi:DNA-binding PadR family transcriptional regulator